MSADSNIKRVDRDRNISKNNNYNNFKEVPKKITEENLDSENGEVMQ